MDRLWQKIFTILGLVLFSLAVALLIVFYRFPYHNAALNLKQQIEAAGPLRVDFESIAPGRPFVCRLDGLRIGLTAPGGAMEAVRFERVILRLEPLSLLTGRLVVSFHPDGGTDKADGRAEIHLFGDRAIRLEVRDIDLPGFSIVDPRGQGALAGRLTGRVTINGRDGVIPTGGRGTFEILSGRIDGLNVPQLPLGGFDFERAGIEFELERFRVLIKKLDVESPQGGMVLAGRIDDLRTLRLNLTGSARVGPASSPIATATVNVTGPMDRPQVAITNTRGPGGIKLPGTP